MDKSDRESVIEKLRQHAMDIILVSMVVGLAFILIKNKQESKKSIESDVKYEIKSVTDVKQIRAMDTLNTKTR